MASETTKLHILMFPWLAFGHIIPYLELAKLLAQRGNKISFVSTPRNIQRFPKLPPNLVPNIDLIGLPLPRVENLPEDAESTSDLPYHKVRYLKIAYDELQHCHVSHLLQTLSHSLDCAILDFASYCLFPVIEKLNIPAVYFSIFTASTMGFVGPTSALLDGSGDGRDFTVKPGWVPFDTNVVLPRCFEMKRVFKEAFVDGGNVSDVYRLATTVKGSRAVAVRSSYEFEPEWLKVVEDIYQKPIIPVGLLPTTTNNYNEDDEKLVVEWREIKEWLDKQEKGSVLYVAFGSETKPNQEEVVEIALGLELSEIPFFWVFRNQRGSADEEMTELPLGFEERIRGRGVIHTSWAPQVKILSHDSVGGVLSHSGWSTVVEAVRFEKPLVLLPFLLDQGVIARQVAGKKLGYEIPRNDSDGSFDRKSVAKSLRVVMVEEEGRIYRDKAKEMKALLFDEEKQNDYVNKLLDYLHALTSK